MEGTDTPTRRDDQSRDDDRAGQSLRGPFYRARLAWAALRRFGRLIIFGFELLILSRLFEKRKPAPFTEALLRTKSIDVLPPELFVRRGEERDDAWTHGFSGVNASLFLNLRNADALSPCRYAHPGPPFRAVYLWDSAFIAQVWKWWDPEVAWEVLRAVIDLRDGDRLQHFASEFSRTRLTQPPLVAWSLDRLCDTLAPAAARPWLEEAYAPLCAYHEWLRAHRALPNGLYAWAHPYESGVENAPRFSTRDERRLDDTRTLAAPDFSAYVALQCEALSRMARRLGRGEEAALFAREADELRARMNEFLWDDVQRLYFDRDVETGAFVRSRTIASLLPLWAGAPDARRAARLLDAIVDPRAFNTLIPLPSVALDDEAFERDMWRGPVWLNTAYAVIEGLRRYRYDAVAADLAFRLCDGVYRTFDQSGHFYEFYDPTAIGIEDLHRKRGNRWKRVSLGGRPVADFVGWTGLVNTLALEALIGLQRTPQGLAIAPRLPPRAAGLTFCLALPGHGLEIEFEAGAAAVRGEIRRRGGSRPFSATFGEAIPLETIPAQRSVKA